MTDVVARSGSASERAGAAPRPKDAKDQGSFRSDIQGLRAVAVSLVVLDHLWGWPRGGFVGVDVFYVISGYLITGILLRESQRTGWISFGGFYARRVRRILPAALVVLVATTLVTAVVWYVPRALQTDLDSAAAALFVANWHFVREGANYLQATSPPSPVQHYWSLSIEEQFYVFWPWIVLGLIMAARWLRTSPSRLVVAFAGAVIVVSFTWSVIEGRHDAAAAYFNTFGRCWELAAGSLIAAVPLSGGRALRLRRSGALIGLGVVVASAILIAPSAPFPGPWAALPVAGTAAVIAGAANLKPLAHPVAQYLGTISYSLYLWHFPVIIIGASLLGTSWWATILLGLLALGASHVSYRQVEERFRHPRKGSAKARSRHWRRREVVAGGVAAAAIVVVAAGQMRGPQRLVDASMLLPAPASAATPEQAPWQDEADLRSGLERATRASRWPSGLTPNLNLLGEKAAAPEMAFGPGGCRNSTGSSVRHTCLLGDPRADKTAIVVGDSIAASWMPAIGSGLVAHGWRVLGLTFANCPLPLAHTEQVDHAACDRAKQEMIDYIAANRPDLVLTSSALASMTNLSSGASGAAGQAQWESATEAALRRIKRVTHAPVVVVASPVQTEDPLECATRFSSPGRCSRPAPLPEQVRKVDAERDAAARTGNVFMPTAQWFCVSDGCPPFVDGTLIRIDEGHLTNAFDLRVSTLFFHELQQLTAGLSAPSRR